MNGAESFAYVLGLILGLGLAGLIWGTPIILGIKAAKMKGRSPHWMWFGLHPLGAWIAFLILRYGVSPLMDICPICGTRLGHSNTSCPNCNASIDRTSLLLVSNK